jgi:hypothetical protein
MLAPVSTPASADNAPVGTAFTYQGRLTESGEPVTGMVDLTFRLFDQAVGGSPLNPGGVLVASDFQIGEDGFFTIDLDFGDNFNGEPRWLEIQVDADVLAPRQPIMAAPHAMVATTAANVPTKALAGEYQGVTGVGTLNLLNVSGNVGVGTTSPQDRLHVAGTLAALRLEDTTTPGGGFTQIYDAQPTQLRFSKTNNNGQVLMDFNPKAADGVSNATFRLFRETNTTGTKSLQIHRGNNTTQLSAMIGADGMDSFFQLHGGNVGIGTSTPESALHVVGDVLGTGFLRSLSPIADSEVFLGWGVDENGDDMARIRIGGNGVGAINGLDIQKVNNVSIMRILNSGNVGIGTTLPTTKLDVVGTIRSQSGSNNIAINHTSINSTSSGIFADGLNLNDTSNEHISMCLGGGSVGIGTVGSTLVFAKLHVDGGSDSSLDGFGNHLTLGNFAGTNIAFDNNEIMARNNGSAATLFLNHEGGQVHIGQGSGGTGRLLTPVLQITGGSDLSENFDVTRTDEVPAEPGMVVCIDPDNPGKLIPSTRAYDRTVAGVISGAGGVKPGMLMGQQGTLADGEHPVALTGRVYVYVDADASGAIQPGDLLTTSDVPGHAMKVADHGRAQGAIIGKAMTSLDSGRGLVLVLVSLQ